jgi:DNA-binding NarL/FixJ family response regulator
MLVDDHDLVRQGIRSLIGDVPDWTVSAEAGDSEEALKLATTIKPDIAIVDISLPQISGIDFIIEMKKLQPQVEILVLTMYDSERIVTQALRAGARGYVLKTDSGEKLIEAVEALSRHQPYFSNSVSDYILDFYLHHPIAGDESHLTPRERQLVKLVAEGNSNKQIARLLNVSIKTVETHRAAAMRKIGAKTSADLALYAVRNQLVQV